MAARGGRRPGAGRKKGVQSQATKKRKEYVRQIVEEGNLMPLQVMLEAMQQTYKTGGAVAAVPFAQAAAPYIHPKLAAVEAVVEGTLTFEQALAALATGSSSGRK
jgi:hypothetical protein